MSGLRNAPALTRQGRITADGSPQFPFDSPAIAANATWVINLRENTEYGTRIAKYLPLDFIEVLSNQLENVDLVINGQAEPYRILGNSQRILERRRIESVQIVNLSANAIVAAAIRVIVERTPVDADRAAYQSARAGVR